MQAPVATAAWQVLAALVGGRCLVCRAWCREALCADCDTAFARPAIRCPTCALRIRALPAPSPASPGCARCITAPPPWSRAIAAVDYAAPWNPHVGAFKFQARVELASAFAALLARAIAPPAGASPPPRHGADLVLPVPLAPARLRERGYNQAWELARRVARRLGMPACADALFRVRDTPHQLALSHAARAANLHDAFAVSPRHAARVRGARIALVDDVLTTGATAGAAARALRTAGAADVRLWVFARTPAGRDA